MTPTLEEHQALVEQKMLARAERNARERQAVQAALEEEALKERAALGRAEQERQRLAQKKEQHDLDTAARRQRPMLLLQYKDNPAGIRRVAPLQHCCLNCGSEWIQGKAANSRHMLMCKECRAEWYISPCWSCTTGWLDSRDPETPACTMCGRIKCAECGACHINGCSTNPYSNAYRQRDAAYLEAASPDSLSDIVD